MTSSVPIDGESANTLDEVIELFESWGQLRYDEEVSQLDHALQTAALARHDGAHDSLVAAALLHDVGHLLELRDGGERSGAVEADLGHEMRGAAYLSSIFPGWVTDPIAGHVAAKRYRCAVDPEYTHSLSAGSLASLRRQGGPMNRNEVDAFERQPRWTEAVRLRGWDDDGKVEGLTIAPLSTYRVLLDSLVRT